MGTVRSTGEGGFNPGHDLGSGMRDGVPDAPPAVRRLTRELVATPSYGDESAAGDVLVEWLRTETDAAVTRDRHGNVFARRVPGTASPDPDASDALTDGPTLALVGHHDVVPPDGSQVDDDGYRVEERDGRLYGRGTADMKGSLAAAACAFRDATPAVELVFVSFVGEEAGGQGCRAAIEDGFAPDYAVVGEGSTGYSAPGVTDVAVGHKGRRGSTLVATGESAHASEPAAGLNAVYRACDAVDTVRDLDAPSATVLGHGVRGSVAVTGIDGGESWNVIPERCEVTVDERTVPGDRADLARAADPEWIEWVVDQDLPPMACSDEEFADATLRAARDAQTHPADPLADDGADAGTDATTATSPEQVVKPHATDAGWLAARANTACVVCGAAEPGEAHTATESVSLPVLDRCYRLYRLIAERFDG